MAWAGTRCVSKAARETAESARAKQLSQRCHMARPKCWMEAWLVWHVFTIVNSPSAPVLDGQPNSIVGSLCQPLWCPNGRNCVDRAFCRRFARLDQDASALGRPQQASRHCYRALRLANKSYRHCTFGGAV